MVEEIRKIVKECDELATELNNALNSALTKTLAEGSNMVKEAAKSNMDAHKKGKKSGVG